MIVTKKTLKLPYLHNSSFLDHVSITKNEQHEISFPMIDLSYSKLGHIKPRFSLCPLCPMIPGVILMTIPECTIINIQDKLVEEWSRNSDFPLPMLSRGVDRFEVFR